MERLTKRNENGIAVINVKCPEGCEYSTCSMEEGYQCQHQCEEDIIEKLAEYEDAEEKGLLVKIKCQCKDCSHWINACAGCTDNVKLCDVGHYMVGANGFCVYAERKRRENEADCVNACDTSDDVCEWRAIGANDNWSTSCDKRSIHNVFGVAGFKKCPYCGRKIKVV